MAALSAPAGVTRSCGSGLLDQAYVAEGRLHAWTGVDLASHLWDLLPGQRLLQFAGGETVDAFAGADQWTVLRHGISDARVDDADRATSLR
jgi:fructose-1,6-bisphosphatase/inositol monophosphatase family enzyme